MAEYRPGNVPPEAQDLPAFMNDELNSIAIALSSPDRQLQLYVLHAPPPRYSDGTVVLADGVDWNPGSGSGFYGYRAGLWRFLG